LIIVVTYDEKRPYSITPEKVVTIPKIHQ